MASKIIETLLRVWPQWVACIVVTLLSVTIGLVVGWTSPYIAQLVGGKGLFYVTENQASWIASLMPFGRLFGAIIGSAIMEFYGSKSALLMTGMPLIVGWICIIFANSAMWLYVSRICSGISVGMFFCCFSLYIGEIAAADIRGALVSIIMNGMPTGTLMGNAMGSHMSMMWFGVISLAINVCYIAIFLFLPHTPHYHVRCDNMEEAKKTIKWYYRKSDVAAELAVVENYVRASRTTNFRDKLKQIGEKKNKRIFVIVITLFVFMQVSGLNTVVFYMELITRKAQVTVIEPENVVIIASAVGIGIGWVSVYLIDRCGRRLLMAISCSFVIVAMVLLALHFMLLEQSCNPRSLEWLPILAMLLFMMMSIGLVPVPSTILGELFPADLRSMAGFAVSITSATFSFICSITYMPLVDLLTEKYVFAGYASLMTMCLVFSVTCVPETKGKTLQEIQEMLTKQNRQGNNNAQTEYG